MKKTNPHLSPTKQLTYSNWRFLSGLLGIALLLTLIISSLCSSLKYEYEEKLGSLAWSLFPSQETEKRITIVSIDEHSLSEIGAWPWSRETIAELSNSLSDYGTSLQLFDIVFPEPKVGDDKLLASLQKNNAVLAQVPILDHQSSLKSGVLSGALANTRCEYPIPNATNFLANTASLSDQISGHITPIVDHDGMIRKQPPLICIEGQVYPSLAFQGILSSLSSNNLSVSLRKNNSLQSSSWGVIIDSYFGLSIPIDNDGNMRISYHQSPDSFQTVSAVNVLNGSAPKALLENTWVIIGATAFGLGDVVPTPHSGMTPGVELQARLLSSLLDGKTPFTPSYSGFLLFFEGAVFAIILLLIARTQSKFSSYLLPISTIIFPISAWFIHSYLLSFSIWIGWFNVALFTFISASLFLLADHQLLRYQHLRVFSHLNSYLPKSVAHNLINTNPTSSIQAKRRDLVLLCADLRNFSAYEESRPPEEAAALLHYFFTESTGVIESFGGSVEEYKGDSLLASWSFEGASNATDLALKAANALQKKMAHIIPERPPKGLEPLALGIGIERGLTLVGSIGPAHRRHHTLLGDTVTISLRIQELTQDLAQPILVGECAARDLHGNQLESQGSFLLDGLTTPHVLFAPRLLHVDPLTEREQKRVVQFIHHH